MSVERHPPGSFCTSVLHTGDVPRAIAFYGALFDWTADAVPGARETWRVRHDGHVVAAFRGTGAGEDVWVPHVAVNDAHAVAAQAVDLGGTLVDDVTVGGLARLVTMRDPEGAVFGLWQSGPDHGSERTDEVGTIWWIEVLTNDRETSQTFYGALFGWTARETALQPFDSYVMFEREGRQEGGLLPIHPDWDVLPHWNTIFAVSDADETARRTRTLGGAVHFVHTVPTAGRIAILGDPGDALFVVRGPVPPPAADLPLNLGGDPLRRA